MKTVIIFHPKLGLGWSHRIPLPLLSIARMIDQKKYSVKLIDAEMDVNYKDDIIGHLDNAVCFAVSSLTGQQIKNGLEASRLVKEMRPDIPVVWGGWHASTLPVQTVMNKYVDIVVKGQGEVTFAELVKELEIGGQLSKVAGIVYKNKGKVIENPDRPLEDINSLPRMPYGLVDVERYIVSDITPRSISYISSLGCPFSCKFCVDSRIYKRRWMGLDAEKVLGDLEMLVRKYKVDGVVLEDNNFFVDINRAKKIAQGIIRRNLNIKWYANARIDQMNTLDDETFGLFKRSGCQRLLVGAESGSQKILELIDKKTTVEDILEFARMCKKYGFIGVFSFMVGFPDQPIEEDFNKTFDIVTKIMKIYDRHEVLVFFYSPYPGTPLFELSVKRGFNAPKSLEAWSNFDLQSAHTPWINRGKYEKIISFYLPMAFPRENFTKGFRFPMSILFYFSHKICRLRWNLKFFGFPFEFFLFRKFQGTVKKGWKQKND